MLIMNCSTSTFLSFSEECSRTDLSWCWRWKRIRGEKRRKEEEQKRRGEKRRKRRGEKRRKRSEEEKRGGREEKRRGEKRRKEKRRGEKREVKRREVNKIEMKRRDKKYVINEIKYSKSRQNKTKHLPVAPPSACYSPSRETSG
jgi:hypothetical protein